MSYKQLTQQQRYHIDVLWKAGYTQSHMADEVGVHKSTITREMRRNSRWKGYYPEQAQAFCYYQIISKTLDVEFYFAHPYSAWERGVNENTNGLVRQYLRKGCDFSPVTDDDLIFIMDRLNNRPRKTLGYKTPNEVFAMEFYSQAA